jgi:hypothetical protein
MTTTFRGPEPSTNGFGSGVANWSAIWVNRSGVAG